MGTFASLEAAREYFAGDVFAIENGVRIEEHYQYHDDDGQSGSSDRVYSTGRDILNVLGKVFRK